MNFSIFYRKSTWYCWQNWEIIFCTIISVLVSFKWLVELIFCFGFLISCKRFNMVKAGVTGAISVFQLFSDFQGEKWVQKVPAIHFWNGSKAKKYRLTSKASIKYCHVIIHSRITVGIFCKAIWKGTFQYN